jgi:hypothetical protein
MLVGTTVALNRHVLHGRLPVSKTVRQFQDAEMMMTVAVGELRFAIRGVYKLILP